jgi:hypothetical protein
VRPTVHGSAGACPPGTFVLLTPGAMVRGTPVRKGVVRARLRAAACHRPRPGVLPPLAPATPSRDRLERTIWPEAPTDGLASSPPRSIVRYGRTTSHLRA